MLLLLLSESEVFAGLNLHFSRLKLIEEVCEEPFELLCPQLLDFLNVFRDLLFLFLVVIDLLANLKQIAIVVLLMRAFTNAEAAMRTPARISANTSVITMSKKHVGEPHRYEDHLAIRIITVLHDDGVVLV